MRSFQRSVDDYNLLPRVLVPLVALLLPLAEITVAVGLVVGVARPFGAVSASLLLTAFAFAMAINLLRGRRIDCGCAGNEHAHPVTWLLVGRNLALVGALSWSAALLTGRAEAVLDMRLPAFVIAVGVILTASACRVSVPILGRSQAFASGRMVAS